MSLFIFQIIIRQWDKGQASPSHLAAREALPARYAIVAKPSFSLSDIACILDQHGDDLETSVFKDGRIKQIKLSEQRLRFDRFQVTINTDGAYLEYLQKDMTAVNVGVLEQGWIQCTYNWRYGVEVSEEFYWMYEKVILNVARVEYFDEDYFYKSDPAIVFTDQ